MNTNFKASNFIAFWRLASWSDPAKLKGGFHGIGLAGMEPLPLPPQQALKEALNEHFKKRNILVRNLKGNNGLVVFEELKGESTNEYQRVFSVRAMGERGESIDFNPLPSDYQDIVNLYAKRLASVPGDAVGSSLVRWVRSRNGVPLRDNGGFYSMSHVHADVYSQIQQIVEGAATEGHSRVYKASMLVDTDSIKIVRDAIQQEIHQESARMLKEMQDHDLGERAMKHRLDHLVSLQDKVKEYEGIIGQSLQHLAEALDNVKTATGLGAFQDMMRSMVA